MPQQPNHYHTLGISPSVNEETIKRAYRALAKRYHPDRVPAKRREWARTQMADINAAYEVLGDPLRRTQYDREQGYEPTRQPQTVSNAATRRRTQRVRERSRRGRIERQRVVTLISAAILGVVLITGLTWFRWLGQETTVARCAWAIALAVGTLMVLAALRLTEL